MIRLALYRRRNGGFVRWLYLATVAPRIAENIFRMHGKAWSAVIQ